MAGLRCCAHWLNRKCLRINSPLANEWIRGGDIEALKAAITVANSIPDGVQTGLKGDFVFSKDNALQPITGFITLLVNRAGVETSMPEFNDMFDEN